MVPVDGLRLEAQAKYSLTLVWVSGLSVDRMLFASMPADCTRLLEAVTTRCAVAPWIVSASSACIMA